MSPFKPLDPLFEARVRESLGWQEVVRTLGIEIALLEAREITLTMPDAAACTQQHAFVHAGIVTRRSITHVVVQPSRSIFWLAPRLASKSIPRFEFQDNNNNVPDSRSTR